MRCRHAALSLVVALCLAIAGSARADGLDDRVQAEMRWQRIPGLSLAVIQNGKVVRLRGYGFANLETQTPTRPQTVYRIGSVSKQFIAAGIMVLVQDGKLKLDDPVRSHLDGTPESWREITIRNLLSHTAGLPREFAAFDPFKVQSDAELVASIYALPLRSVPGTKWEYSNPGYYVLAEVIRRVAGQEWPSFIARRVFTPAGMTSTRAATPAVVPDRASGYETRNGELQNAEQWLALRPSGGFLSTVADFARWDAALYGEAPLTSATREQMWSPATLRDGQSASYGLGWSLDTIQGHRHVHHGGGVPGFVAEFHRFSDARLSVVVMANIGNRDLTDLVLEVAGHYLPGLLPAKVPAMRDPQPALTATLRAFIDRLPKRTFDESLLTPESAGYLREDLERGFADRLREQGRLGGMELLEQTVEGENRVYRYRLTYPNLTLFAVFKINPQNRIASWSLTN